MSRLAQLVERKTLYLVVVGSSPTVGVTLPHAAHAARVTNFVALCEFFGFCLQNFAKKAKIAGSDIQHSRFPHGPPL